MTNGQIERLQELRKCHGLSGYYIGFVDAWLDFSTDSDHMHKEAKALLRRLAHQYRNQIAAMKRNRQAA